MDGFFASVNAVSTNPADTPSRQQLLSSAQSLVSRFQSYSQQIDTLRDAANQQISNTVDSVNGYAAPARQAQPAHLGADGAGRAQDLPNDLLDQRDQLVSQINAQLGVTPVVQSDGSFNLFLSNGQALVIGSNAQTLVAVRGVDDPQNLEIGLAQRRGRRCISPAATCSGGALSGVLAFRDTTLHDAQNELGRVAIVLARRVQRAAPAGPGLEGQPRRRFLQRRRAGRAGGDQQYRHRRRWRRRSPTRNALTAQRLHAALRRQQLLADPRVRRHDDQLCVAAADGRRRDDLAGVGRDGGRRPLPHLADAGGCERNRAWRSPIPAAVAAATPIRTASGAANAGSGSLGAAAVEQRLPGGAARIAADADL